MSRLNTRNMRDLNERAHQEAAEAAVWSTHRVLGEVFKLLKIHNTPDALRRRSVPELYALTAAAERFRDAFLVAVGETPPQLPAAGRPTSSRERKARQ